jgi:hypothetical protein
MHKKDLRALIAYLGENAPKYPLEVLRAQMIQAGHKPEEAEQAIGVFQGRIPPPESPAWPGAMAVTAFDFALVALCWALFPRLEKGLACSAVALLPSIPFLEFIAGLLLLGSRDRDQYRRGRALLLGVLSFVGLGLAMLVGFLVHWLSTMGS